MTAGTATQREFNRHLEREYLDKFFEIVTPGQEFKASYIAMAERCGVPANIVGNVMKMLANKGVLQRRFEYRGPNAEGGPGGRDAYWTIITTKAHAKALLDEYQAGLNGKRRSAPKKKNGAEHNEMTPAPVTSSPSDVDVSREWAQKCREYMTASGVVTASINALKAAGITVDESAYLNAIQIRHDETLAAIALVMPYIEYLESHQK